MLYLTPGEWGRVYTAAKLIIADDVPTPPDLVEVLIDGQRQMDYSEAADTVDAALEVGLLKETVVGAVVCEHTPTICFDETAYPDELIRACESIASPLGWNRSRIRGYLRDMDLASYLMLLLPLATGEGAVLKVGVNGRRVSLWGPEINNCSIVMIFIKSIDYGVDLTAKNFVLSDRSLGNVVLSLASIQQEIRGFRGIPVVCATDSTDNSEL